MCADRVIDLYVVDPDDDPDVADAAAQVRDALARTHAYGAGQSTAATEIRLRMVAVKAASKATTPQGAAAARAVAQASAVAHMGAHALGAAGYAAKAIALANPDEPDAWLAEIDWQTAQLADQQIAALKLLPLLGEQRSGPLGPGLLAQGVPGRAIRELQRRIGTPS